MYVATKQLTKFNFVVFERYYVNSCTNCSVPYLPDEGCAALVWLVVVVVFGTKQNERSDAAEMNSLTMILNREMYTVRY